MKIKILVDPDLCIGAASCVTVDPSHFELNDENKAVVLDPVYPSTEKVYERVIEIDESKYETLLLACQSCPTLAIFLFDVATGKQLFPEV